MNRQELDRTLVTILNEHRHEQIDTEKALYQIKKTMTMYFGSAAPGRTIKELGVNAICTCKGFQRDTKCPVHGITNIKHKPV